jgi:hypothetical protein
MTLYQALKSKSADKYLVSLFEVPLSYIHFYFDYEFRLKGKVLIKGKRMSEEIHSVDSADSADTQEVDVYETDSDDDSEIGEEHKVREGSPVRYVHQYYMRIYYRMVS